MAIQTELTRALGIRIPLVQGGMQWVSVLERGTGGSRIRAANRLHFLLAVN